MATGPGNISAFDDIENFLECEICFNSPTTPKLLPCGHSFCLSCLEDIHKKDVQNQTSTSVQTISCPKCRDNHTLPTNGVKGFPTDHRLNTLKDLVQKYRQEAVEGMLSCGICQASDKRKSVQIAVFYCTTCSELLCKSCGSKHRRLPRFQQHVLAELSTKTLHGLLCVEHVKNFVQRFCLDCERKICKVCTHTTHGKHNTTSFVRFDGRQEQSRKQMCEFLERSLVDLKAKKAKVSAFRTKHKESLMKTKQDITARYYVQFENVRKVLQEQEQKLHEKINENYKIMKKQFSSIETMLVEAEKHLSNLQNSLSTNINPLNGCSEITCLDFPSKIWQEEYSNIEFPVLNNEIVASTCQFTPGHLTDLGSLQFYGNIQTHNNTEKAHAPDTATPDATKPLWETKCGNISDLVVNNTNNSRTILFTSHEEGANNEDIFHIKRQDLDTKTVSAPPAPVPDKCVGFCTIGTNYDGSTSALLTEGPEKTWQAVVIEKENNIHCLTLDNTHHYITGQPVACAIDLSGNMVVTTIENPNEGSGKTALICYTPHEKVLWYKDTSKGTGPGQLLTPWSVCVDPFNRIIIADYVGSCIQIYSDQGIHLKTFHPGEFSSQSVSPVSVCTDASEGILVGLHEEKLVCHFTPSGRFIRRIIRTARKPKVVSLGTDGMIVVGTKKGVQLYELPQHTDAKSQQMHGISKQNLNNTL